MQLIGAHKERVIVTICTILWPFGCFLTEATAAEHWLQPTSAKPAKKHELMNTTLNIEKTDFRQHTAPGHDSDSQMEPRVIVCLETGAVQAVHTCTAGGAELWCDYYARQFNGIHFIAAAATQVESGDFSSSGRAIPT
jgi:hypothetical protein